MRTQLSAVATALLLSFNASAATTSENKSDEVETIEVFGQYLDSNKSNAIKTPTQILDVPQSLSIFTADDITKRNIISIGQIIDYTPGVNTSQGEGHRDAIVFRGVRSTADFYIDGARDDVQYFRSLYNIEQVEILRGPNALLFGRGGTGGVLNRVTKKAQLGEQFTGYKASVNSFGGNRGEIDTNFATSENSAIRINGFYEHLENHRDFFDGDRIGFNPTAHFSLSDDTTIDLSYEYINHERFIDRGIITDENGPVEEFRNTVFGDPENNFNDVDADVFRVVVEHNFSDSVKGNFSLSYADFDKVYSNFFASDFFEELNLVELDGYIDTTERQNTILSANIIGEFETGAIEHTLLVGAEAIFTDSDQNRLNANFEISSAAQAVQGTVLPGDVGVRTDRASFTLDRNLDFRDGASGNSFATRTINGQRVIVDQGPTTVSFSDLNDDTRVDLEVYSFFIQDEIALSEHLDLIIGARYDSFDIEVFNAENGVTLTNRDEEISPRGGIVYKPQENISIYASYSESFLPRSGEQFADINSVDDRLDADTFTNKEIGLKWDFKSGLSLTAAIFENEQTSLQTSDIDVSTLDVIDEETDGFEIQLAGQITKAWHATVNYSYLDGEIVDEDGDTGLRPRELPENTFSLWNNVQVNNAFGFAIGATFQDESFINNSANRGDNFTLPSYVRYDAAAYYDVSNDMRIQLNLENLTDKEYFPNSHAANQVTVGAPFNASLTLTGKF